MSTDADLERRFELLAPPPDELDWLDVVRRARELQRSPRSGRRRVLLLAAALLALLALAGAALALTGSTTGVPAIDRLLHRADQIEVRPGEPGVDFQPRPGSASERLQFTVDGTRYTAVAFRNRHGAFCTAQVYSERGGAQRDGPVGCVGAALGGPRPEDSQVRIFAGGGGRYLNLLGFARADVKRIVVSGPTARTEAKLSRPWSPEPWKGPPIRFFYVLFDAPLGEPPPGHMFGPDLKIEAHLADGRVVRAQP